jgi:chromosome transmission fidelity protein 4
MASSQHHCALPPAPPGPCSLHDQAFLACSYTSISHRIRHSSFIADGKFDSNVTRFTLPLRALAFSATGGTLAAGGDDDGIRLISVADASISQVLRGHNGSVSSLAFDPRHTLLGSSSSDGTVLVHDVEAAKVLHKLHGMAPKGEAAQGYGNTVQWHPDGNLLAVPGGNNEVSSFKWTV